VRTPEDVGVTEIVGAAALLVSEPALAALTQRAAGRQDSEGDA
jgi:hypothetical protein